MQDKNSHSYAEQKLKKRSSYKNKKKKEKIHMYKRRLKTILNTCEEE